VNKLGKLGLFSALLLPPLAHAGIGIGINIGLPPPPPSPAVVVNAAPPGYQPGPYWYWCGQPAGYFPAVSQCAVPWQTVPAGQAAPAAEAPPPPDQPQPMDQPQDQGPPPDDTSAAVDQAPQPPPEIPDYDQPPMPAEGYLWTPGYWAYGDSGYYWVPGTWVQPPSVGLLWTPGYWGWSNGVYAFNAGYWGPQVGFYGGINYGFGYGGSGYGGGRWNNGAFAYNNTVNNFGGVVVRNSYRETVITNSTRVSFNGGNGGIHAAPTPAEQAFARQSHIRATAEQTRHEQASRAEPAQRASFNGGHPSVAATARPGAIRDAGAVGARGAAPMPPRSAAAPSRAPAPRPAAPAPRAAAPASHPKPPEHKPN